MGAALEEDERLTRLTNICVEFPKVVRTVKGLHATFAVNKKPFAYFVDDHHSDKIVGLLCKVLPGDNAALIAASPARFFMPAYVGPRGWVGLRLDGRRIDWGEVEELARCSYELVSRKRLPGAD
jgi:hypothetical protein